MNRSRIVSAIMVKPDTQAGIARRTGLSQATVSTMVRELEQQGLLPRRTASASGRSRALVALNETSNVAVGVDIGYNHTTVVARRVDQSFDRVRVQHGPVGASRGLRSLAPMVVDMVRQAAVDTGRSAENILSIGVSVPRMVNPRTGRFTVPVLPPWTDEDDPADQVGRPFGVRAVLDNDANLGALAAQCYGGGAPAETVMYVKGGTGVGAGIIVGGTLLRGSSGTAGELGHLTVDPDGAICQCGGRGCLETVVGAEALLAQVRGPHPGGVTALPGSLVELIDRALAGDGVCRRAVQDAGRMLGFALAQACTLLNPDLIVLGGQLAAAGDLLLQPCREAVEQHALPMAVRASGGVQVVMSDLSPLAEAQGALVLGLNSHELDAGTRELDAS